MKEINLHNYQAFLLDYLEGNLNEDQVSQLMDFLEQHPQLKEELNEAEPIHLPELKDLDEYEPIEDTEFLKKTTEDWNEFRLISYLEGDLSKGEQEILEKELKQNPDLQKLHNTYQLTRLSHEQNIQYPEKTRLFQPALTDEDFIAYSENIIDSQKKTQLEALAAHSPSIQKEIEHYQKMKVTPDMGIIFPQKEKLKREAKILFLLNSRSSLRYAAAILLLVGLAVVLYQAGDIGSAPSPVAQAEKPEHQVPAQSPEPIDATISNENSTKIKNNTNIKNTLDSGKQLQKATANKPVHTTHPTITLPETVKSAIAVTLPDTNQNNTLVQVQAQPIDSVNTLPAIAQVIDTPKRKRIDHQISTEDETNRSQEEGLISLTQLFSEKIITTTWDGKVDRKKKLNGIDLLGFLTKKIKKNVSDKVDANASYTEDGKLTAYSFTVGSLSFSRKTNN